MKYFASFFVVLFFIISFQGFGQVGIGTVTPDASALLEIKSTDKGFLPPRVSLDDVLTTQLDGTNTAASGLLIYNTNALTVNGSGIGYYYFNGTSWVKISSVSKINELFDAKSDDDGTQNGSSIYMGIDAGKVDDLTNNNNLGLGYRSLEANITGSQNVALGNHSLRSNDTGEKNVAIGYEALRDNLTGTDNTAIGYFSMRENQTGRWNTAVGDLTLIKNTSGNFNTALGYATLRSNTEGSSNTAIGKWSLRSNLTGDNNIAIGNAPLQNNEIGDNNIAIGLASMYSTEGYNNVALGTYSFEKNVTGSSNVAMGYNAGRNKEGNNNVFLGYGAGSGAHAAAKAPISSSVFIGYNAGRYEANNNRLYISNSDTNTPLIYGEFNTGLLRINGKLNINNAYDFPVSAGSMNQIMVSNGSGLLQWQNPNTIFNDTDTDNQGVDVLELNGTNLSISLDDDGEAPVAVSLASLQDGTGTDNQKIDALSFDGTNLSLSLEDDGEAPVAINLSSLQDGIGTDNQKIDALSFDGTNLSLSLEDDGEAPVAVNLSSLQDGTGTDSQKVDLLSLVGTNLNLSLENDVVPNNVLNLSSLERTTASNGITRTLVNLSLGGNLNNNTTITQGNFNLTHNLNGTGDFLLNAGGTTYFSMQNSGISDFGGSTTWHQTNTGSVAIARIIYGGAGIGGRMILFSGGTINHDIQAEGLTTFNLQGRDQDFKVEGDSNENLLYIDASTDRVGIRDNTPLWDLQIKQSNANAAGSGGIGLESQGNTNNWKIYHSGSHFSFAENGVRRAYVEANSGDYIQPSDKNLKTNISELEAVLPKLDAINLYRYHYKTQHISEEKNIGVMAQEVQPHFPELVAQGEDGTLGMNYAGLSVIAIKAIKEQKEEIETLKTALELQNKEVDALKLLVNQLINNKN